MKNLIKKHFTIFFLIFLFGTSCNKQLTFEELIEKEPVNVKIKTYSSEKLGYSLSILEDMKMAHVQYNDTIGYEQFDDATDKPGFAGFDFNLISMMNYSSESNSLKEEWGELKSRKQDFGDDVVYSEGITDYLGIESYYEHSSYSLDNQRTECIYFLMNSKENGFYLLQLSVPTWINYPENLISLLYCVKSINISN